MEFIKIEGRVVVARGWGRGGELVFNGDSVSVWEDDKVPGMVVLFAQQHN